MDETTPPIALVALCSVFVYVILVSTLVQAYAGREVPLLKSLRLEVPRKHRGWLLLEGPLILVPLGVMQLVMVSSALSADLPIVTRLIGALEVAGLILWSAYLLRLPAAASDGRSAD